jgi:hypothetical protein
MNTTKLHKRIRRERALIGFTVHAYIIASLGLIGLTIYAMFKHIDSPQSVTIIPPIFFGVLTLFCLACLAHYIREHEHAREEKRRIEHIEIYLK